MVLSCGEYGGGLLSLDSSSVSGIGGFTKTSRVAGFGHIGAGFQVSYHLGAGVELVARLDAGVKLGSISAERDDGTRIFTSPAGDASGSLGLGYRF